MHIANNLKKCYIKRGFVHSFLRSGAHEKVQKCNYYVTVRWQKPSKNTERLGKGVRKHDKLVQKDSLHTARAGAALRMHRRVSR